MRAFTLLLVLVGPGRARVYTLDELLPAAYTASPEIRKVEEEVRKTDSQVREAYGSALPKLDFSAFYQYAFAQYSPLGAGAGTTDQLDQLVNSINPLTEPGAYGLGMALKGMMQGFADITKDQTISVGLALQGPLYAQGKVSIGLKIARIYKAGLQCKLRATRMEVASRTTKLFYGVLLAQKNVDILQEAVRLAGESLRLAEVRQSLGKGSELEVLGARLNLEKMRMDLATATGQQTLSREALIKQAGLQETTADFSVSGEFPEAAYAIRPEEALVRLQQNNQQIQQLATAEEIQGQLVRLARSDFYPMAYYGANVGKLSQFNAGEDLVWYDNQNVFVGLSLNLFKGGQTRQKINQARCDLRSFQETKRQAQDGLELAVQNAYQGLENSRQSLASAEAIVQLAEKGYSVAKRAYEVGLSTRLDLEKAELDLKSARLASNAALFAFTSAVVDMKTLTNTLETE